MQVDWWWLIIAAMGGAIVGVVAMCLCRASSEYEEVQSFYLPKVIEPGTIVYLNSDIKKDR